ncbi:hypothetical protein AGMMS49546_08960 [Spirochaetia bacterium]|nr:hypothetical protein AGMMS49546_08960 [Spirochaetia bacterium]
MIAKAEKILYFYMRGRLGCLAYFFKGAFYEILKEGMAVSAYTAAFYVLYDSGSAGKSPTGGERTGSEGAGKHNDPAAGGTC